MSFFFAELESRSGVPDGNCYCMVSLPQIIFQLFEQNIPVHWIVGF